jgi:hypothetical protein
MVQLTGKRRYAMDVSVIAAHLGRELYRKNGFIFESYEHDVDAITTDGQQAFLTEFKPKFANDPTLSRRVNGVRYKLRTFAVRTA